MLIHLRRAGVEPDRLVNIYVALIRTIIEYAAQMYHYLLTGDQSGKIESLQRNALKIILGPGVSYAEALERTGLKRLSERREDICANFTRKTYLNPRYTHWFPPNNPVEHNLRKRNKIREEKTTTDRMKNSPVYCMRRYLNTII